MTAISLLEQSILFSSTALLVLVLLDVAQNQSVIDIFLPEALKCDE